MLQRALKTQSADDAILTGCGEGVVRAPAPHAHNRSRPDPSVTSCQRASTVLDPVTSTDEPLFRPAERRTDLADAHRPDPRIKVGL